MSLHNRNKITIINITGKTKEEIEKIVEQIKKKKSSHKVYWRKALR